MSVRSLTFALPLLAMLAAPACAQSGWHRDWDRSGWGMTAPRPAAGLNSGPDSREGIVNVAGFLSRNAIGQLGHGPVTVVAAGNDWPENGGGRLLDDQKAFEAAVVSQLVDAGYDTVTPDPDGGQITEIRVLRATLVPQQPKPKPVSGEMSVGVSNRGSMVGVGLAVNLTKPRPALISTRLEARVRDRATGKTLWEGHADMATYEGDDHWNDQAIAERLASVLFKDFPNSKRDVIVSD